MRPLSQDSRASRPNGTISWIEEAFGHLPANTSHPLNSLWRERLLKSRMGRCATDGVDERSSRLVWSALAANQSLMVALPDFEPHRPAILLATGLIYSWLYPQRSSGLLRPRIVYFGSHVGIREHLSSLELTGWGLRFSDVFPQQNVGRSGSAVKGRKFSGTACGRHTPELTTVYAPADPVAILSVQNPEWIAIDLGDSPGVHWLTAILRYARERQMPVICWSQNPLSSSVSVFEQFGSVLIWPWIGVDPDASPDSRFQGLQLWQPALRTTVRPVVLVGPGVASVGTHLRAATAELCRLTPPDGTIAKAAVLAHWRLLRNVEGLCVPLDFYEVETQRFYGLRPFSYLLQSCASFRNHASGQNPSLVARLETVGTHLSQAIEEVKARSAPLWVALGNIILDEPGASAARVLIFSSRSRKQLFVLALLAHYNITEDDLAEVGTYVMTLEELHAYSRHQILPGNLSQLNRLLRAGRECSLLLASVPSSVLTGKLLPCFSYSRLELLAYTHQVKAAYRRIAEWAKRCNPSAEYVTRALGALTRQTPPVCSKGITDRIVAQQPVELEVSSGRRRPPSVKLPLLLDELDAADEIARLFDDEIGADQEDATPQPALAEDVQRPAEAGDIWCDHAICFRFEHGWTACYAPEDKLNVVVQSSEGLRAEERYVRAVQPGDRVVLIYGERRQSLYDLFVSRIHNHPKYALHVALVKRWQADVAHAFTGFAEGRSNPFDELLYAIQALGSNIQSVQTIRSWRRGDVLCPEDPEDLRRVGQVLQSAFIVTHYRRISEAAKRLRTRHRTLARWLNSWIVSQIGNAEYPNQDAVIDEELGITFEDFRDSFLLLRVIEKKELQEPILLSRLGRLERNVY